MLLMVTGHPRSGTEMLLHLCNSHPQVALTLELGSLRTLWVSPRTYAFALLDSWRSSPMPVLQFSGKRDRSWRARWQSARFVLGILWQLRAFRHGLIGPRELEGCYRNLLPRAQVVGDKLPNYSLCLDHYAGLEDLKCVVIYRHVFSVVQSYLEMLQRKWASVPSLASLNSAEKIAQQWVHSVRQIQRNRNQVLALSYEDLLVAPAASLERLAQWLGVDAAGFSTSPIPGPKPPVRFDRQTEGQIWACCAQELAQLGYPLIPEFR
jgi:hypothetical protein